MEHKVTTILLVCLLLLVPTLGYFGYYLAVGSDQYEVVRFAQDLAGGSIFRSHPVFDLVKDRVEQGRLYPIHYGGYLLRDGRIFCKYAIGYPLILAAFISLLGLPGAFFANFIIYSVLLLVIYKLGVLYFSDRPDCRPLALGASLLFFLLIDQVWKLSATPHGDVASLFCLTAGVYLLVRAFRGEPGPAIGWIALAGLFLGFSVTIRTPNILMLMPAGLYCLIRLIKKKRPGRILAVLVIAALAVGVGLSPALYQNYSVNGSIWKPPQSHEIHLETVTDAVREGEEAEGSAIIRFVRRVPEILTKRTSGWGIGNIHAAIWPMLFHLLVAYGPLFGLLFIYGLVKSWKKVETRLLFLPIIATFLIFYSGWVRPLERYLIPLYPFMTIIIMGAVGSLISTPRRDGPLSGTRFARMLITMTGAGLVAADFLFRSLNPRYPHRYSWDIRLQYISILLGSIVFFLLWWYQQSSRKRLRYPVTIFNLAVLAGIILNVLPTFTYKRKLFQLSEARQLRRDLDAILTPPSIIFATKFLSQTLDLFTESNSLRPSDLDRFIPDYGESYDLLMREGFNLYLINNKGKRNAAAYIPMIRDYFSVEPIAELPAERYHLEGKFGRPVCTIFAIKRWDEKEVALDLATPVSVDYLLTVNFYKIRDSIPPRSRMEASLAGREWPGKIDNYVNYFPLRAGAHTRPRSVVRFTSDQGLPEDIFLALQWLDRDYLIRLGPRAPIPDRVFLSEAFYYSRVYKVNWRWLGHSGYIRIPTVSSPRRMLTAEFRLQSPEGRADGESWQVFLNGTLLGFLPVKPVKGWQTVRLELPREAVSHDFSRLELRPVRKHPGSLMITSLRIASWFKEVDLPTPEDEPYLLKAGIRLAGSGGEPYLELNGRRLSEVREDGVVWEVLGSDQISRPLSKLQLNPADVDDLFHVSLLEPLAYPLKIDIGRPEAEEFMGDGFHTPELHLEQIPVCWTVGRSEIFLPFIEDGMENVILRVGYFGIRPDGALPATVSVILDGEKLAEFPLQPGAEKIEIALPPGLIHRGVSRLELAVPPWKPSDHLPVEDSRELGLMLDYVEIRKED
jgi:hypothetical protein